MNDTGMNTMKVKIINKSNVYKSIYKNKRTCKALITQDLGMGLSTVNQNLKLLEEEGLICRNGFFESTGGRKADALEIVTDAKISIGVAILKNKIHILACGLYGEIISKKTIRLSYKEQRIFYKNLTDNIMFFIEENKFDCNKIMGVAIATQGIVSHDGEQVSYGRLLGNHNMKLSDFQEYIPFPCRLEHDSKAAASLELFKNPNIKDGVLLLLNENMGGAIITDRHVLNGLNMSSGIIEHMSIHFTGRTCYCGRNGCLETYCSKESLELASGMDAKDFFKALDSGNTKAIAIWDEYLTRLGQAISNLILLIDGHFIISGHIAPYFKNADIQLLLEKTNTYSLFPVAHDRIVVGESGEYTQALGAALYYTNEFLGN